MAENMNVHYDKEGDYLEITSGDIANCYFKNIGNGVFEITDKETQATKGIAIFSLKSSEVTLPFKLNISHL